MSTSKAGGRVTMKLTIKTAHSADYLLRKIAVEIGLPPEDLAEVAVYNLLASYLVDKYGQDSASSFLEHLNSHSGGLPWREPSDDVGAKAD